MSGDGERRRGWLETFEISSKAISIVITPIIVGLIGSWYTASIKEREREVEIMKLLPQLLSQDLPGVRLWAIEVIGTYSGVPVPDDAKEEVVRQPLSLLFSGIDEPKSRLTREETTAILEAATEAGTIAWVTIALAELGVTEIPGGDYNNPRILDYHRSTSLQARDDETPWNSSFVNWVMAQAGYEPLNSAAARRWLEWGESTPDPVPGAIAVFSRPPHPTSGHVGFYLSEDIAAGTVTIISGNSDNSVQIDAYPVERLIDYRLPTGHQAGR